MKKKMFFKVTSLFLAIIFLVLPTQTLCASLSNIDSLSNAEYASLSFFNEALCNNQQIIELKKLGELDKFIDLLYDEYNLQKQENEKTIVKLITFWGLSFDNTLSDLRVKAENYLEKNLTCLLTVKSLKNM